MSLHFPRGHVDPNRGSREDRWNHRRDPSRAREVNELYELFLPAEAKDVSLIDFPSDDAELELSKTECMLKEELFALLARGGQEKLRKVCTVWKSQTPLSQLRLVNAAFVALVQPDPNAFLEAAKLLEVVAKVAENGLLATMASSVERLRLGTTFREVRRCAIRLKWGFDLLLPKREASWAVAATERAARIGHGGYGGQHYASGVDAAGAADCGSLSLGVFDLLGLDSVPGPFSFVSRMGTGQSSNVRS